MCNFCGTGSCVFYAIFQGGLRAVLWTDVFQVFVMFAGIIAIVAQGVYNVGGFGNVWAIAQERKRIQFLK